MLAFDRQVRSILVPTNGKSQLGRAAEAMYMLEPDYSESAYQVAFNDATARFRRRSLFIVLTDLVEAVVEQALLPALPTITRRHLVVVAAVQDPAVTAWAAGGAHRWASEAYREAAAVNVLLHEVMDLPEKLSVSEQLGWLNQRIFRYIDETSFAAAIAFELDFVIVAVIAQAFALETGRVGQVAFALILAQVFLDLRLVVG